MNVINQVPEMVPVALLHRHPENPKRGAVAEIRASIRENGFYGFVVAQLSSRAILVGNHRYDSAIEEGATEIPTVFIDVDDDRARRILLADNRTSDLGTYDERALAALLNQIQGETGTLVGTAYAEQDLETLLQQIASEDNKASGKDPDEEIKPPEHPVTLAGELWTLGRHRLLCGDSTVAENVSRLLNGAKPHLMVTDPPYGVEYDAGWRADIEGAKGVYAVGKVQNDDRADWSAAWALFPGDVAYVWHAALFAGIVSDSLAKTGLVIRSQIIWNKTPFVFSRGDYHWKHEPCWYAVRKGATGHWTGDRTQSTVWDIAKPRKSETGHSTQKPVECMRRPLINNSNMGDAVYEPFSGSGTTLIACEMESRRCFAIELDRSHCDVAIRRWEALTSQVAVNEAGLTYTAACAERNVAK